MGSRVTFSAHESDRLIGASETVGTNFVNGKTSLNTVYTPSRQAGSNAALLCEVQWCLLMACDKRGQVQASGALYSIFRYYPLV